MSRLLGTITLALFAVASAGKCGDRTVVDDCMVDAKDCTKIFMMRDGVAWGCKAGGYGGKCTRPIEGRDFCKSAAAPAAKASAWGKPDAGAKPAVVAGYKNNEENFPSLPGAKKAAPAPKKKEGEILAPAKPAWGKPTEGAKPAVVANLANNEENFPSLGAKQDAAPKKKKQKEAAEEEEQAVVPAPKKKAEEQAPVVPKKKEPEQAPVVPKAANEWFEKELTKAKKQLGGPHADSEGVPKAAAAAAPADDCLAGICTGLKAAWATKAAQEKAHTWKTNWAADVCDAQDSKCRPKCAGMIRKNWNKMCEAVKVEETAPKAAAAAAPKFDCEHPETAPVSQRAEAAKWCKAQRSTDRIGAATGARKDAMDKSMEGRRGSQSFKALRGSANLEVGGSCQYDDECKNKPGKGRGYKCCWSDETHRKNWWTTGSCTDGVAFDCRDAGSY